MGRITRKAMLVKLATIPAIDPAIDKETNGMA
jgi:hypothetical protein